MKPQTADNSCVYMFFDLAEAILPEKHGPLSRGSAYRGRGGGRGRGATDEVEQFDDQEQDMQLGRLTCPKPRFDTDLNKCDFILRDFFDLPNCQEP